MTSMQISNIITRHSIEIPEGQSSIEVQGDKTLRMFALWGVSLYYTEVLAWDSIQMLNFMLNENIIASFDFSTIIDLLKGRCNYE